MSMGTSGGSTPPDEGPAAVVRRFYEARLTALDVDALRPLLAPDVVWQEPEVGGHMGRLLGVDAVLDMIRRALAATDGTFRLEVAETMETRSHCVALVEWSARPRGRALRGREIAVFRIGDGRIREATFYPEDLADDHAFWGEPFVEHRPA